MIASKFGRTYPGSFSASTAFIERRAWLVANPSADAWMIASLRSIRGVRGEQAWRSCRRPRRAAYRGDSAEGAALGSRCPNRREGLADEQAALRSMAALVAPSVAARRLLRSAVRSERHFDVDGARRALLGGRRSRARR
jgi:hypothetical protein